MNQLFGLQHRKGDGSLCVLPHKKNRPQHARSMPVAMDGSSSGLG